MDTRAQKTLLVINLLLVLAALALPVGLLLKAARSPERTGALGARPELEQLADVTVLRQRLLSAHDRVLASEGDVMNLRLILVGGSLGVLVVAVANVLLLRRLPTGLTDQTIATRETIVVVPANLTPKALQALAFARQEAHRFNHNFIGTEHILLALIRLGQGVAVNVLQKQGLDLDTVRMEVEKQVGTGPDQKMVANIPYTPRVKKVFALAAEEAESLQHQYVGTEHLLLGLLREGDGVAARVLTSLGLGLEQTRQEILKELGPSA